MESKTLIQLLNYSRTLIYDGEIKFLLYKQYPTHPDDVGAEHRKFVASWERQLRENPPKSKNPEALRKEILGNLEKEKKYGDFRGHVEEREIKTHHEADMAKNVSPTNFYTNIIDDTQAEVELLKNIEEVPTYIITYSPRENIKAKIYVRLKSGLPVVFREESYFKGDSPQADAEGYWLAKVNIYSDFERVEELNIFFPKVREDRQFRRIDGFMRHRTIITIKEMDFNLGLSVNFFDWNGAEQTAENDRNEKRHSVVRKEESQETQK